MSSPNHGPSASDRVLIQSVIAHAADRDSIRSVIRGSIRLPKAEQCTMKLQLLSRQSADRIQPLPKKRIGSEQMFLRVGLQRSRIGFGCWSRADERRLSLKKRRLWWLPPFQNNCSSWNEIKFMGSGRSWYENREPDRRVVSELKIRKAGSRIFEGRHGDCFGR